LQALVQIQQTAQQRRCVRYNRATGAGGAINGCCVLNTSPVDNSAFLRAVAPAASVSLRPMQGRGISIALQHYWIDIKPLLHSQFSRCVAKYLGLYAACYQRFALHTDVKITPAYDSIELNRSKTLLWGLIAEGVPKG
jgi:hypothetical protein